MKPYDHYNRGDIVVVIEKKKDERGKKVEEIIGKARIVTSDKSSIDFSTTYIPWNPIVSVAQDLKTGEYYSNSPCCNFSFYRVSDYISFLKKEKEELLEEVNEICELIRELSDDWLFEKERFNSCWIFLFCFAFWF